MPARCDARDLVSALPCNAMAPVLDTTKIFVFRSVDRRRLQFIQSMLNLILAIPKFSPFILVQTMNGEFD